VGGERGGKGRNGMAWGAAGVERGGIMSERRTCGGGGGGGG